MARIVDDMDLEEPMPRHVQLVNALLARGMVMAGGAPCIPMEDGSFAFGWDAMHKAMLLVDPPCQDRTRKEACSTLKYLAPQQPIAPNRYIAFSNGVLDVTTGELMGSAEFAAKGRGIVPVVIPHEWRADAASDEAVEALLDGVSCGEAEVRANLEEIYGLCMSRFADDRASAVWLYGEGQNGKSTFIDSVVWMVGERNAASLMLDDFTTGFNMQLAVGKLAVIADDQPPASVPKGVTGATGPQGPKGETGDTGATGPQGPKGDDGHDGVSCTHSWNGTVLSVTSASGTSSADLVGPQGPQGAQGATGPAGVDGSIVSVVQALSSGTEIGSVTVDGTETKLYAPASTQHMHAATDITSGAMNIRNGFTGTPGSYSVSEGTTASAGYGATGNYAHAEGSGTRATGTAAHAEGYNNSSSAGATGNYSHSEGQTTRSGGIASHAEGNSTSASGREAHAEGVACTASGGHSHAEGCYTTAASESQHAGGRYNVSDSSGTYAEIIGNGTSSARSNARTLDWSGNEWLAGSINPDGGYVIGNDTVSALGTGLTVANGVLSVDVSALGDLSEEEF